MCQRTLCDLAMDITHRFQTLAHKKYKVYSKYVSPIHFVVDVGCGSGDLSLLFVRESKFLVGIDPGVKLEDPLRPPLVKLAHDKSSKLGINNVAFIRADGANLPLRDGIADKVLCIDVLEHIGEWNGHPDKRRAERVIFEALRICNEEGRCLISVPNRWFPIEIHTNLPLLNYFPQKVRKKVVSALRKVKPYYIPNVSLFSSFDFKRMNLAIKERHFVFLYGYGLGPNIEKRLLFRIIRKLSRIPVLDRVICSQLVLVCSKQP